MVASLIVRSPKRSLKEEDGEMSEEEKSAKVERRVDVR